MLNVKRLSVALLAIGMQINVVLCSTESQQIERVIKEKEEQVASLLLEGEKLAQVQLKANNTIKKLRSTIKDNENDLNVQT